MVQMTTEAINFCIKRKELIRNPQSCEKLYLSNQGFSEISNLDRFINVNEVFLARNAITEIRNLERLSHLRDLNLSNNKIDEIENVACCPTLKSLDLSRNEISNINDHLSWCEKLETLRLSHNKLSTAKSISNLLSISKLRELDLSWNKLDGEYGSFMDILGQCKHLKVLSLQGNPIVKTMPHYRKMVISRCRGLTCLDGREICREERRRVNAWGCVVFAGGTYEEAEDASRRELIKILAEKSKENAEVRRLKAMTRRAISDGSQTKSRSKKGSIVSSLSPAALGLGHAMESKPTSSFISNGIKKAYDYFYPSVQRSSIHEKEPLLFEDPDGSIRAKKPRKPNRRSRASSNVTNDSSPLFLDTSPLVNDNDNDQPLDLLSSPLSSATTLTHRSRSTARTSGSSSSSSTSWSKISREEFDYRERNSFYLLPPPPPPRSAEKRHHSYPNAHVD